MKKQVHRKNFSEVITPGNLNLYRDANYPEHIRKASHYKINEEQSRDVIFSESFSDLQKIFNMNMEEISVLETNPMFQKNIQNYNNYNKVTNKNLIKIITHKFHELFLKLVNQIKVLKLELTNLKKKSTNEDKFDNPNAFMENESDSPETDVLKYLMNEELECFNQILFDSNIQLNELQAQEESLRREILRKHKEIEKFNLEIEECKKQKDVYVKELQNIAVKLTEYKSIIQNPGNFYKKECQCDCQNKDSFEKNRGRNSMVENYEDEEDDINMEDYQLLMNADNREYLIRKVLQENKKYKSIVRVMKTEESEFGNYLIQLETELDNFAKFKNFCLTKMNAIDENVLKCRDMVDTFTERINNVEFHLEIYEDGNMLTNPK